MHLISFENGRARLAATTLTAPGGSALRQALSEPARACGYQFEDDELVAEMLEEVDTERGALPLLAFATARLWEKRDRDRKVLTRAAYREIGGVGGALAQHADATLEGIGARRESVVREIFRNLVTSKATRVSADIGELLTVFDDAERDEARDVLGELIDARLVTSYEAPGRDVSRRSQRVEITSPFSPPGHGSSVGKRRMRTARSFASPPGHGSSVGKRRMRTARSFTISNNRRSSGTSANVLTICSGPAHRSMRFVSGESRPRWR